MKETKQTYYDNMLDHLMEVIFNETTDYIEDCTGNIFLEEELHDLHSILMAKLIEDIYNRTNNKGNTEGQTEVF